MIRSFRHKGLQELFETSKSSKVGADMHRRAIRRLMTLNQAVRPGDMNIPGFDFHPLKGFDPTRYTVLVNGPWCITFSFENNDAIEVDFEQYR
jgi:proteic killer suppression protein